MGPTAEGPSVDPGRSSSLEGRLLELRDAARPVGDAQRGGITPVVRGVGQQGEAAREEASDHLSDGDAEVEQQRPQEPPRIAGSRRRVVMLVCHVG